jgi:hypothetical protein
MIGSEKMDPTSFDCPFQRIGMGKLICAGAITTMSDSTDEVTPKICKWCEAGRIFREVGCDAFTPEILLSESHDGISLVQCKMLCKIRRDHTHLSDCVKCDLVTSETTKNIISITCGLFKANNFESALNDLEKAKMSLRDGDYPDVITSSISSVESVMRSCLESLGEELPTNKGITGLWKALKKPLALDTIDPSGSTETLLGNLSGAISHLGGLRNNLGDAHGKGIIVPDVPYSLAELSINAASTLSTMIIRRYLQVKK